MISVLDTSAVMRLFIADGPLPSGMEERIAEACKGNHHLMAPELMLIEVANVLQRRTRLKEIDNLEGSEILRQVLALPIRIYDHAPFVQESYELALEHSLSAYDALFLALARQHGARLYTCDQKLLRIAQSQGLG